MCGQLSHLVIYLLITNGFKYEDIVNSLEMISNFISTDIAGNVLGNGNSNEIYNKNYPTKLQNDIDYIITTGDTLKGDLNLNLGLLKAVLTRSDNKNFMLLSCVK